MRSHLRLASLVVLMVGLACAKPQESQPLIVFTAGSLARPLKAVLDSFARAEGATYQLESGGSLETARKLTELGRIPDVIALADVEVFPQVLAPRFVTWYATFATNRMVIAKSPKARFGTEINGDNWWTVLQRPGVEVGRADPDVDPAGYRTLLVFQLVERETGQRGLAKSLESNSPKRNIRPKSAELTALVQAGEFDYAWEYESVARAAGLDFVSLSPRVNLGSISDSLNYAAASLRVLGASSRDTVTVHGAPIRYALSIPTAARNRKLAERAVAFLASPTGAAILTREFLVRQDSLIFSGTDVPPSVRPAPH